MTALFEDADRDERCEWCEAPEYSRRAGGVALSECYSCHLVVCSRCHVGGDDVVDACKGCR